MVNSFTTGKGRLVLPPYGSYVDEWNKPCNSDFSLVDALISGTTTLNVATLTPSSPFFTLVFQDFDTSTTPWLNPLAGQNLRIAVTGALAFNVTIFIPANVPGMWLIDNQTSGGFTVTVVTNAAGSVGIAPPQGYISYVFCDGTNVKYADAGGVIANGAASVPPGTILSYGGPNIPAGYIYCNGQAVSRSQFAALYAAIGNYWGAGDGSSTFNVPNLIGMFLRGAGGNGAGLAGYQGDQFGSHAHGINDPGHGHVYNAAQYPVGTAAGGPSPNTGPEVQTTSPAVTGITIQNAGGNETRPQNFAVYYMIKY